MRGKQKEKEKKEDTEQRWKTKDEGGLRKTMRERERGGEGGMLCVPVLRTWRQFQVFEIVEYTDNLRHARPH